MGNNNSFMYQSGDKKTHNNLKMFPIGMVFAAVFFFLFFVNCIFCYIHYKNFRPQDLTQEQLTFQRYEYVNGYKSKRYEIYFTEYEKPFVVDTIADSKMDRDALKSLAPNTAVTVYYDNTSYKDYDYEICHLTAEDLSVLTFDEFIKANKENQITGFIFLPIVVGLSIYMAIYFKRVGIGNSDFSDEFTEHDELMLKYLDYTIANKKQVLASKTCRCAHCLATFSGAEVIEFIDEGKTAVCPKCGVDAVLPDCAEGLNETLLQELHDDWFGDEEDGATN